VSSKISGLRGQGSSESTVSVELGTRGSERVRLVGGCEKRWETTVWLILPEGTCRNWVWVDWGERRCRDFTLTQNLTGSDQALRSIGCLSLPLPLQVLS